MSNKLTAAAIAGLAVNQNNTSCNCGQ